MLRRHHLPALAAVAGLALVACLSETTFVEPGSQTGSGSGNGDSTGVVQRARLDVTVTVHGSDSALAGELGGPPGVLPNAAVTVQRQGTANKQTDTTDATGHTSFTGLTPGTYSVSVARLLTAAESAVFDSADRDVNAFGGGAFLSSLAAPGESLAVSASAGRRGSLVFSEVYDGLPIINGRGYDFAGYLEIYNNSDTTIYLDGKVIGTGPYQYLRATTLPGFYTCDDSRPWRLDPDGIWSPWLWQFPGSGRDHPLVPGRAAVIAMDAIDHSVVDPRLPNLSGAEFEFIGSQDADNPRSANMINATPLEYLASLGHGFSPAFGAAFVLFIADSLNVAALPAVRPNIPNQPNPLTHYRVPTAKVLDVFASFLTPEEEASPSLATDPPCQDAVLPVFDRRPGNLLEGTLGGKTNTIIRMTLATLSDGRAILQRTGASANDFALSPVPTPGYIR